MIKGSSLPVGPSCYPSCTLYRLYKALSTQRSGWSLLRMLPSAIYLSYAVIPS